MHWKRFFGVMCSSFLQNCTHSKTISSVYVQVFFLSFSFIWLKVVQYTVRDFIQFRVINSRTAVAGAIIGLLLVFFCRRDFRYDHMTSQPLQVCFLFILSCNFNWNACVTSFFALIGAGSLFIRVSKFLVTLDLPHSQKWLPQFEIDFYLL